MPWSRLELSWGTKATLLPSGASAGWAPVGYAVMCEVVFPQLERRAMPYPVEKANVGGQALVALAGTDGSRTLSTATITATTAIAQVLRRRAVWRCSSVRLVSLSL